jgi:hypothetical protein
VCAALVVHRKSASLVEGISCHKMVIRESGWGRGVDSLGSG